MPTHSTPLQVTWRIALWSLVLGVIFAIASGIVHESSSSSTSEANQLHSVTTMGTSFSFTLALEGLLIGAVAGAVIGTLWFLPKYGRAAATVLLILVGGFAGLAAAGFIGAQTTMVVSGNSVSVEHGPPREMLVVGTVLGMVVTAVAVWGIRRSTRRQHQNTGIAA